MPFISAIIISIGLNEDRGSCRSNKMEGRCESDCGGDEAEPAAEQSTKGGQALSGRPKFKIKRKSRCLQKSKLVDWEGASISIGGTRLPLAPALG